MTKTPTPVAMAFVILAGLLLALGSVPLCAQEGQEQPEEKSDKATEEAATTSEADETQKIEKSAEKAADEKEDSEAKAEVEEKLREEVQKIESGAKRPWFVKWKVFRQAFRDITNWDFKEGMFRLMFGIRFQLDFTGGNESAGLRQAVGPIEESANFRRGTLFADGDIARRFHFRFEYDFAVDRGLKDAFLDNLFREVLKSAALRVGHFKEPFSLERQTSRHYGGFLERSLPVGAFAPGRGIGIAAYGSPKSARLAWAAGLFSRGSLTEDDPGGSDFTFTGRITGLPQFRDHGKRLVHLGLSASVRNPKGDTVTYKSRPEARFAPIFLDTGGLSSNQNLLAGLEFATVQGPTWIQAEFIGAQLELDQLGRTNLGGGYVQAGWFLTGENKPYQRFDGTFGRLTPLRPYQARGNPFRQDSPGGAIEFTGRASWLDLNDGPVQAGEMFNVTLGMNWYPTRVQRCMFNYIRSDVEGVGSANTFLIRYQFNPGYHWPPLDPRWRQKGAPKDAESRD